jgi:hypothetical protein
MMCRLPTYPPRNVRFAEILLRCRADESGVDRIGVWNVIIASAWTETPIADCYWPGTEGRRRCVGSGRERADGSAPSDSPVKGAGRSRSKGRKRVTI